jgi:hypothetical protein
LLDIAVKVDFLGHWHLPPDVVIPGKHPSEIVPKYSERKGMIQKNKSIQIIDDHN